jgi:hypothetical protein
MMRKKEIRVTSIGHVAHQVLRRTPSGLVTGVTSRGIYLQPLGDLTLYLTRDSFRGPLTINIRDESGGFSSIQPGEAADFIENTLTFGTSGQVIHLHRPLIWKPSSPPGPIKPIPGEYASFFHQVQANHPEHPYLPLLEMVTAGEHIQIRDIPGIEHQIIHLLKSLGSANPSAILSGMESILGAGPGLTPLGDDILLGILLAMNRARSQICASGDVIHFYDTLLKAAEENTTTLSWSLLSCAIQGSADERIIRVLDGLTSAREIPDHDLLSLLDWGSSSGMAVLAGILMALA